MMQNKIHQMEEMLLDIGGSYILNHAKRTLHIARLLASEEGLDYDEDILVFAAYFHDISAFAPYRPEGKFNHALESSKVIPDIAKSFGYSDEQIKVIVEAVKYHDKVGCGECNETILIRNADGVDYLGVMTIARDFSKSPKDMRKAVAAIKKHRKAFYDIIELESAKKMADKRMKDLGLFLKRFEEDSFGIY